MQHTIENGIYGEGDIWKFYSISEAEEHENSCPNWPHILERFKEIYGKVWEDRRNLRYRLNGVPVYEEYTIVGVEDNDAWADYYWILKGRDGKLRYELTNNSDFYNWIK